MKVSYLTDPQVREEYLRLLTRIDDFIEENKGADYGFYEARQFWNDLGYSNGEIPDY